MGPVGECDIDNDEKSQDVIFHLFIQKPPLNQLLPKVVVGHI